MSDRSEALEGVVVALEKARARLGRRLERIEADLARAREAERGVLIGQLLLAQARHVPRGTERVTVVDYATGAPLDVVLSPADTAAEHAERLFAEARRMRRGEPIMRRRASEAEDKLRQIDSLLGDLRAESARAADGDGGGGGDEMRGRLEQLVARAAEIGVRGAGQAPPVKRGTAEAPRRPYNAYRGAGGRVILVGRGGADNDALTTQVARPRDLWLHAKGQRGAHVVVPLERGEACPSELLVDAATLAAHHSDARGELVCEVSVTPRRYVQKRRRSAPGAVVLLREKVVRLRTEPERLERLLASKE